MINQKISLPLDNEYATFYSNYVDANKAAITPNDLLTQGHFIIDFLKGLSNNQWNYRYQSGKWSIKEMILHIIDCERIFLYRLLRIARGDTTPMPGFNQNLFLEENNFDHLNAAEIIDQYEVVRKNTVILCSSLLKSDWERIGIASDCEVSARAIFYIIVGHELHHYAVLKERYL